MNLAAKKYQFVKVEEYFRDYQSWQAITAATAVEVRSAEKTVLVSLTSTASQTHLLMLQWVQANMFRCRFAPAASSMSDYALGNTRAVVQDNWSALSAFTADFSLQVQQDPTRTVITTLDAAATPCLQITITRAPFSMQVAAWSAAEWLPVLATAQPALRFTENGFADEHAVICCMQKSATAKFVGFGEHGGKELVKNTAQLTYFNYDNMKYMQVYGRGPLEAKEPLYHSDPFFMEFNGTPGKKSAYGIFVDNPSQVCMDIGYLNSTRYMFGTRFGLMDYYFMYGATARDIVDGFTTIVGKARLKPRYCLGYQQGCYGYDTREKVENCARSYRAADVDIPLDGIHIDVDMQRQHKTFTMDAVGNFPQPQEMFAYLRGLGVKCSTNITPIVSCENPQDGGDPQHNPTYTTPTTGLAKDYFLRDTRADANDADARQYYYYEGAQQRGAVADQNFNNGQPYVGGINYGYSPLFKGYYPDLGRKEVRRWWGEQYQYLFDMGLEMVWQDMTTPAIAATQYWDAAQQSNVGFGDMKSFPARLKITNDFIKAYAEEGEASPTYPQTPFIKVWNLYAYNLHKATYHGLNNLKGRENRRNFIVGRGSFAGAHRFAALWTGDNASTWDFLRINIAQCLALGLTGQAMAGQDIGGFEKGDDNGQWADPELLIRWTAAGAFLPWFRNHYTAKPGAKLFQEPYAYRYWRDAAPPEYRYMYDAVLPVCKYYIELRYRLLQLFYDRLFENTLTGMPICRALFLSNNDDALFNDKVDMLNDQFTVGDDLLVAPIVQKGQTWRDVYLPAGSPWYCYMDNLKPLAPPVEGGTTVSFCANIDASDPGHIPFTVPLYVRAGAIIPTIDRERYVGELHDLGKPRPITLNIYPCGPDGVGSYDLFLDDGLSRSSAPSASFDDAAKGEYRHVQVTHRYLTPKRREIVLQRRHDNYTPPHEPYYFVAVLHDDTAPLTCVTVGGEVLQQITGGSAASRAEQLAAASQPAWYYNENIRLSCIKVFDTAASITLELTYP